MMRFLFLLVLAATPALAESLFEARQLTPAGEYTGSSPTGQAASFACCAR